MIEGRKKFDLEDRTLAFAGRCRDLAKEAQKIRINLEYGDQLIRSSGSVAANYIEANEGLSSKDFTYRIKICRKEIKESRLWLRLILVEHNEQFKLTQNVLLKEATELMNIFGAIFRKMQSKL